MVAARERGTGGGEEARAKAPRIGGNSRRVEGKMANEMGGGGDCGIAAQMRGGGGARGSARIWGRADTYQLVEKRKDGNLNQSPGLTVAK